MIKYFQKLRAKKGFTLVELIVVIAIIGVLAAILIPTMLGYVTQSKVTSANSTAASIKNEIDAFLTQCDTVNKGMKKGTVIATLTINITNNGTWTVSNDKDGSFNDSTNWKGTNVASGTKGSANHLAALGADLKDLFPEIKSGAMTAYLRGGKTFGVLYVNGVSTMPAATGFTWSSSADWPTEAYWANDTQGICTTGEIIGTAPVIPLGPSTSTVKF